MPAIYRILHAPEGQDQGTQGSGGDVKSPTTLEEALAENAKLKTSVDNLDRASKAAAAEARKSRESLDRIEKERRSRETASLPEIDQLQLKVREAETERQRYERDLAEEKAGRVRDRQDHKLLLALIPNVDPDFLDYALMKVDRDLLETDEAGNIVAGVEQAVARYGREFPKTLKSRQADKGSGPNRDRPNGPPHGQGAPAKEKSVFDFNIPSL